MSWVSGYQYKKGVRQGCVLSPNLFSLYSEKIMSTVQDLEGIQIGDMNINNLRYADNTALMADSNDKLQMILQSSTGKWKSGSDH